MPQHTPFPPLHSYHACASRLWLCMTSYCNAQRTVRLCSCSTSSRVTMAVTIATIPAVGRVCSAGMYSSSIYVFVVYVLQFIIASYYFLKHIGDEPICICRWYGYDHCILITLHITHIFIYSCFISADIYSGCVFPVLLQYDGARSQMETAESTC